MADIFKFPKASDLDQAAMRATVADQLCKRGVGAAAATSAAKQIIDDYREFTSEIQDSWDCGRVLNDQEKALIEETLMHFIKERVLLAWMRQRIALAIRSSK
jgi:hypothetical protein